MGLFKTLYTGGGTAQNWLTLRNGDHLTGLFRGMFEKNTLTFNSGCDRHARPVEGFTDVREPQRQGVRLTVEADEATAAPTHGMALDQGGNPVLVDPHR